MVYTSVNNPKIKLLKQLKQKKYRDEYNLFLVEGYHLVEEAYKSGFLKEVFITEDIECDLDTNINIISENIVKELTEVNSPAKIFGLCEKKDTQLKDGKILILDSVQDPGNMGTIIRSATAFNIDTIVINDKCADIYSSKVIRATQGTIFKVNIIKENLETFIKNIKTTHKILATKVDEGTNIKNVEKLNNFAIIMGSEGSGVSKELLDLADEYINIPMNKDVESLNVAVATSIILYELS